MTDGTVRTWAEIDLGSIEHNYLALKAALPEGCICLGVVKADAYGHGALPVAERLQKLGCGYLAVATAKEAEELREGGISLPILILGPVQACLAPRMARLGVTLAISGAEAAREISGLLTEPLKIHIKLETGMGRTGFDAGKKDTLDELMSVLALPKLEAEGIFTHFAVSDVYGDEYTFAQHELFTKTVAELEKASGHKFRLVHCANSGAVINYPGLAHDMARPGLALYGMYPAAERGGIDLRPAMTLKTRVAAVTHHKKGDTISYGRTFTADRDMRVAVLPIGYADGLHRTLSNKMSFLICGKRARQLGRICMDMCMADVTDIPECGVGSEAEVFGRGIAVEELAEAAGTINYEMVCAVSRRVERVYIDSKGTEAARERLV
jgi:alanine racemase